MCCNRTHVSLVYTEVKRTFEQEDMKMAQLESKKSGGGKLSRSETVTVRLDPKLRYLAELAARKQRRTLSSFIEWAIEDALSHVHIDEDSNGYISVAADAAKLWDVDESDRFAKLAIRYSDLLTHEEQVLWKYIKECGLMWLGNWNGMNGAFQWSIREQNFRFDQLREYWETFRKVASGESPKSELPSWSKFKKPGDASQAEIKDGKSAFDDFEDDIPF